MPNYSEVDIANQALAMIGARFIRSFDEDNKRARMCGVMYPLMRDYHLARFSWPFAEKLVKLQPLGDQPARIGRNTTLKGEIPPGWYAYKMPNDCLRPLDLHPPGSKDKWKQFQDIILCLRAPDEKPQLYYTAQITNTSLFSMTFVHLVSLGLAAKLAPVIAQDKQLAQTLFEQWMTEQSVAFSTDANVGEDYRTHDENPNFDTFVNPDVTFEELVPKWQKFTD